MSQQQSRLDQEARAKIAERRDGLKAVAQDDGPFSLYARRLLELIDEGESLESEH